MKKLFNGRYIFICFYLSIFLFISGIDRGFAQHDHSEHEHDHQADHEDHEDDHSDHGDHSSHEEGHSDEVTLDENAIKLFELSIEPVSRQNLFLKVSAPARVTFNMEAIAHIETTVAGRVKEIHYKTGDTVNVGDVLLTLDSKELGIAQSDFLQNLSQVDIAQITLDVSKIEYERAKRLFQENGISQAEFLQVEGEYKIAEGTVISAQSTSAASKSALLLYGMTPPGIERLITSKEVNPAYKISSPIFGEIIARHVSVGEVVGPDDEALMTIADLSSLWIIASVPDSKLGLLKMGAKTIIRSNTNGSVPIEGMVEYLAPALDEQTRTGQVRIKAPKQLEVLRPGAFVHVEIISNNTTSDTILAVPKSSVFDIEGGPAVFVVSVSEKNTFIKRAITIGPVVDNYIPVLSGLSEGEYIVAKGGFILKAELGKEGVAHEH